MHSVLFFCLLVTAARAAPTDTHLVEEEIELKSVIEEVINGHIYKEKFSPERLTLINDTHHIILGAEGKYNTNIKPKLDVQVIAQSSLLDIKIKLDVQVESEGKLDLHGAINNVQMEQEGTVTISNRRVLSANISFVSDGTTTTVNRAIFKHLVPKNEFKIQMNGFTFNGVSQDRVEKVFVESYIAAMVNGANYINGAIFPMLQPSVNVELQGKNMEQAISYMINRLKKMNV